MILSLTLVSVSNGVQTSWSTLQDYRQTLQLLFCRLVHFRFAFFVRPFLVLLLFSVKMIQKQQNADRKKKKNLAWILFYLCLRQPKLKKKKKVAFFLCCPWQHRVIHYSAICSSHGRVSVVALFKTTPDTWWGNLIGVWLLIGWRWHVFLAESSLCRLGRGSDEKRGNRNLLFFSFDPRFHLLPASSCVQGRSSKDLDFGWMHFSAVTCSALDDFSSFFPSFLPPSLSIPPSWDPPPS